MTRETTMRRRHAVGLRTAPETRWTLRVVALASLLFTASCASGATTDSSTAHVTKRVIASSVDGAPGAAPTVLPRSEPSARAGGAEQQATLNDRTLRIDSASARPLARGGFVAVDVAVTIRGTGSGVIENRPTDYSLVGTTGDVFGTTTDPSAPFWGDVAGAAERRGAVTFEIPDAARSHLQLLYRPGAAGQAVVFPLTLR